MIDVDEIYRVPSSNSKSASSNIINSLTKGLGDVSLLESSQNRATQAASGGREVNEDLELNLNLYKSGKFNLFQRHVNQMLIRGDNVVFVILAD